MFEKVLFLEKRGCDFWNDETTDPYYKIGGWCFPLMPYLHKYWVKTKYYGIREYYAVNKTAIRNELKSHYIKAVEVE